MLLTSPKGLPMLIRILLALITAVVGGMGGYLVYKAITKTPTLVQDVAKPEPVNSPTNKLAASTPETKSLETNAAEQTPQLKFDIVRVEPDGSLVVAGHIENSAQTNSASPLTLLDSGKELDYITPDGQGQFVFAGLTLLPGLHELALSLDKIMSAQRVSVVIGDKKTQPTAPLVALLSPGSPAQVLSQPDAGRAQTPLAPQAPTAPQTSSTLQASPPQVVSQAPKQTLVLAIVSVEYAEAGTLTVIGTLIHMMPRMPAYLALTNKSTGKSPMRLLCQSCSRRLWLKLMQMTMQVTILVH